MAKIVVIKTIPGEELIAEFVDVGEKYLNQVVTISRPRIFQIVPGEDGRAMPSIQPWIQTDPDNKDVPMFLHYIASITDAPSAIEKAYLQTVSGLDLGSSLVKP